jgi:hypothetical protein
MLTRPVLLALAVAVSAPAAWPQASRLRAGYQVTFIDPPGADPFGSALAGDPVSPEILYAVTAAGAFGDDQTVQRVDLTDPSAPVFTPVATGAFDASAFPTFTDGDNVLDCLFGYIGGLAVLSSSELAIVENGTNTFETSNTVGDTIYIARDLNGDGDFRDVVTGTPEVTELLTTIPGVGPGTFAGQQARVAPFGRYGGDLFVVTADGGGQGEVIRVQNPRGLAPSASLFMTGLNFGAGIAFPPGGIIVGESNFPSPGRIYRCGDTNNDGDVDDPGERVTLRDDLPGVFDLTFTNDQLLRVTANDEVLTTNSLLPVDSLFGLFRFPGGQFGGDIVAAPEAGSFAPNGGPAGQRLYTTGNNFFDRSQIAVLEPAPPPAIDVEQSGFTAVNLAVPSLNEGFWGPALAVDPADPTKIFAGVGARNFGGDQTIYRLDITDPQYPSYTPVCAGPEDTDGDGQLDSLFGSIGGLAMLPTGELAISDNGLSTSGTGERVFLARDRNADGDFLDVVSGSPEVTALFDPTPFDSSPFGFTGVQVEVGLDGALYVITSDGDDAGEVIRVTDPAIAPGANLFFQDGSLGGIDYGSGLAWIGGVLFAGDADETFTNPARVWRLQDTSADGDALDPGESTLLTSTLAGGVYDLAAGPGGTLWLSNFSQIRPLNTASGSPEAVFASAVDFNVIGDVTFTTLGGQFAPGGKAKLITETSDFFSTSALHILIPAAPTSAVVGLVYR